MTLDPRRLRIHMMCPTITREETPDVPLCTTRIHVTPPRAMRIETVACLASQISTKSSCCSQVQKWHIVSPTYLWIRASSARLTRSRHSALSPSVLHFSVLTPMLTKRSLSPTSPKSEAVAPRYTWEQEPPRRVRSGISDVLPPSRMRSANNVSA